MGLQQSKEALLYQQVVNGNIQGIKDLHREGANLEWFDKEGKTPLIVACMNPQLYDVAKTLIELGANVDAYRPGAHAGTALHHAVKTGLAQTVMLLLSHGANALATNDNRQTPLDVARIKGYCDVVRTIENRISFFSGYVRELYGPGFLEALVPQLLSRKIWVVVTPRGSRNPKKPLRLELAMYTSLQDARPRTTIKLWKVKAEEPKYHQPLPVLTIFDKRTRYKLASLDEEDKQQLQLLCNACRGIPQLMQPTLPPQGDPPIVPKTVTPQSSSNTEDVELAMAISASLQSAAQERPPIHEPQNGWGSTHDNSSQNGWLLIGGGGPAPSEASSSGWLDDPSQGAHNGWGIPETRENTNKPVQLVDNGWGTAETSSTSNPSQKNSNGWGAPETQENTSSANNPSHNGWGTPETATESSSTSNLALNNSIPNPTTTLMVTESAPSAPPALEGAEYAPIHYPSIDSTPIEFTMPLVENKKEGSSKADNEAEDTNTCVVCLDAPVEGACVPCGHMAGCMSCLNEIKTKKWGCPVCRSKIDQVIRLFSV
ncbi:hypothetical protein ACHQM5_014079 [Ranunculus cassubicifolius]